MIWKYFKRVWPVELMARLGIKPICQQQWWKVARSDVFMGLLGVRGKGLLALLALRMAHLDRKARSPLWQVVFFEADGRERHRSTGLKADDASETSPARRTPTKAERAELEAKEQQRRPRAGGESWDLCVPQFLQRHCNWA
jgi:hypothetical protein